MGGIWESQSRHSVECALRRRKPEVEIPILISPKTRE
jgi:hypothetical protein